MTRERTCAVCGTDISEKRPQAKHCGPRCRAEASRLRSGAGARGCTPDAVCTVCGVSLAGRRRGTRYCGERCKRLVERQRAAKALSAVMPSQVSNDRPVTARRRLERELAPSMRSVPVPHSPHL